MVIHPSTNRAQSCLTSVIGPWMVTTCQWGSYCQICANNKYVPQIPHTCHMYKLFHMHHGRSMPICIICHIWTCWHEPCDQEYCTHMTMIPMMTSLIPIMIMQPNYIGWDGHWPNRQKRRYCPNKKTNMFALTKKQDWFSKGCACVRCYSQLKWQNFPLIKFILPNKMQNQWWCL